MKKEKVKLIKIETKRLDDELADLSYLDQFKNSKDKDEQKYYAEDQKRKNNYWFLKHLHN